MRRIILEVGEIKASGTQGDVITTYALETSVAVILIQPEPRTVGMAHIALPDSTIDPLISVKTIFPR